jgi:hypothetical protein
MWRGRTAIFPHLTGQRRVIYREVRASVAERPAAVARYHGIALVRGPAGPDPMRGHGGGRSPHGDADGDRGASSVRCAIDGSRAACRGAPHATTTRSRQRPDHHPDAGHVDLGRALASSCGRGRSATTMAARARPDARRAARDPRVRECHPFRPSPEGSPARRGVSGVLGLPARDRPDGVCGDARPPAAAGHPMSAFDSHRPRPVSRCGRATITRPTRPLRVVPSSSSD